MVFYLTGGAITSAVNNALGNGIIGTQLIFCNLVAQSIKFTGGGKWKKIIIEQLRDRSLKYLE